MKLEKIHWYIASSVFIVILDYFSILNFAKRPVDLFIIPVKKEIYAKFDILKNFGDTLLSYPQIAQVYEERNDLAKQRENLQFRLQKLQAENTKLRIQLEAPFPSTFKFVPAYVIGISKYMEIDEGSDAGIKIGQAVVDGQMVLGKVVSVTPRRGRIMLLSDPDFAMAAVTDRDTQGSIVGQSGQAVLLSHVLQKDLLFLNDIVKTAGDDQTPPNLLVGKITYISVDETSTYKQATIKPSIDPDREKIVFVITSL